MGTPLKIKISKMELRHVLSWPKLVLEPKFHDPGSFGGFGKRGQTNRQDSSFISIDKGIMTIQSHKLLKQNFPLSLFIVLFLGVLHIFLILSVFVLFFTFSAYTLFES